VPENTADNFVVATEDRVRWITFDRPEKKNAFTSTMYYRLADEINAAAEDPAVRVVVLTGVGDAFTSGNDINDFLRTSEIEGDLPYLGLVNALRSIQKPVVAAVNGMAVGIGTTMLLHCDIVLAVPEARFVLPFARLGICPEAGSSLLLPILAGVQRATELLMLGEPFGVEVAREIGLVNEVVAAETLRDRTSERATALAALPPAAVRRTKRLIRQALDGQLGEAITREDAGLRESFTSAEMTEAAHAFLEKRPPDFSKFE
jgi:enoyl-CoA hydratase/carnithine racemase